MDIHMARYARLRLWFLMVGVGMIVVLLVAGCGLTTGGGSDTVTIVPTAPPPAAQPTTAPPPAAQPTTAPPEPADEPADEPTTTPPENSLNDLSLDIEQVGGTFDRPLYVTHAGDGSGRVFVVEKRGVVTLLRDGQRLEQPFLDIEQKIESDASERGLLSIAFHPDYAANGLLFVDYTNLAGDTIIARYEVTDNPDRADPNSETVLLTIEQPAANHNGGQIAFGPDGYLYIGMGDGGAAGDPWGNALNRNVLLGKILRIDVDQGDPYAIPPDNPFVDQDGTRPEIWAWGIRNPWRFSFDRATGDLYIGDVGQNMYEEVDFQPAESSGGENYGWNNMEGNACYPDDQPCDQTGLVLPVAVYSHSDGDCSVTGGYVYRGESYHSLAGLYFFADYCSGKVWALQNVDGTWQHRLVLQTGISISSFGEDETGELYLTDLWGGKVYRLVDTGVE